jgi:short-subunit dehydrogenase
MATPASTQEYKDRVVIVTGASSGIGRALALRLAGQGACVVLAARCAERLEALAGECRQLGGHALAVPTDVACEPQCHRLIQRARETFGPLDMLVNNAGMAVGAALSDLPDLTLFNRVMAVNFMGVLHCSYYALPYLKETRGRLVNISSLGGKLAVPFNTSYCASKFAVMGFSDALRMELAESGVSLTVICPYWVVSEFHERFLNKDGQPAGPRGRAVYTDKMMTADQCAQITLRAAWRRQREVVMSFGPLAVWLKLLAPGLVDRLTVSAFLGPARRRVARGQAGEGQR